MSILSAKQGSALVGPMQGIDLTDHGWLVVSQGRKGADEQDANQSSRLN